MEFRRASTQTSAEQSLLLVMAVMLLIFTGYLDKAAAFSLLAVLIASVAVFVTAQSLLCRKNIKEEWTVMPISNVNASAAQPLTAAERVLGAPEIQQPKTEARPAKPMMDEYVPEEKREPSGLYWLGKDEEGQPRVFFDDPERAENAPDAAPPKHAEDPEKSGKKEERCVGNTDKVDREIEQLKKKQQELSQRLNTETDERKIRDLERQLAQVERELGQKDNDTYRKQHSTITPLS